MKSGRNPNWLVDIILVIGHYIRARTPLAWAAILQRSILLLKQFPLQIDDLADVVVGVAGAAQDGGKPIFGHQTMS